MMDNSESEKFKDLYEKISSLKAVKCRLTHERIRYEKETNLPIAGILPELGYENVGFCSPEIRAERLACGHTMARYLLEDALSFLESNGIKMENLQNDLSDVTNKIHSLDHEKGFAEKHLARLVEKKYADAKTDLTEEIEKAKTAIKHIENLHSQCVERIENVRRSIISEMRSFL